MKKTIYLLMLACMPFAVLAQKSNAKQSTKQKQAKNQVEHNAPERDWTNAVLWQQGSGEYRALAYQAYNFAKLSLKEALWEQSNGRPNCIIVDADETVIDNSKFQGYELKNGVSYVPADWTKWTALAAADTVPGALSFLKFAESKGVEVFYVTNRDEADRVGTIKNLKALGFPNVDDKHILLKQSTSDKEVRRQSILKDYNVLLYLGDNLSDFSNAFYREGKDTKEQVDLARALFGTKFIVFPNPMYGDWEKPLYKGENLSEKEKAKQRFERLKGF